MSATSIAPCARSSAETAAESSASPPVWVVIARLVRSCRPTLTITTGLPSAPARSSAAAKRSGSRIASMNPPTMAVCGSSRRYGHGQGFDHVERFHRVRHNLRHRQIAKPLVARGDYVPWRLAGTGGVDRILERCDVVVPKRALGIVGLADLPVPLRLSEI